MATEEKESKREKTRLLVLTTTLLLGLFGNSTFALAQPEATPCEERCQISLIFV